jgi:hypothetical protein
MTVPTEPIRPVAIVGAGVSGFIAAVTLRYSGLAAEDIVLFDETPAFLAIWAGGAGAIQQRLMRSESEGHFYATDFPGFALLHAVHQVSLLPLLRSVVNRYNPTVDDILAHGRALTAHYRIADAVQPARIARVTREYEPAPHFALYDAAGRMRGRARNVLLALGHGELQWPAACMDPTVRAELGDVLRHAYEPKTYSDRQVLVIGSGMSAATEWTNVLRAGGSVIAVRRGRDLVEQPLSAPRCSFTRPWLDQYHALDATARAEVLAGMVRGSYPGASSWKRVLRDGERSGRLRMLVGEVTELRRAGTGADVVIRASDRGGAETLQVDLVVAATGFTSGWQKYDVVRTLVGEYGLETRDGHLVLADDCSVPTLSTNRSVLSITGPLARWAFPAADSFAGMKYVARRFAGHALDDPPGGLRRLSAWWDMVRGGWPYGEDRTVSEEGSAACATP